MKTMTKRIASFCITHLVRTAGLQMLVVSTQMDMNTALPVRTTSAETKTLRIKEKDLK